MSDWNEAILNSAAKKLRKFARHKYEITEADAREAVLCVFRSLKRPSVSGGGNEKDKLTDEDVALHLKEHAISWLMREDAAKICEQIKSKLSAYGPSKFSRKQTNDTISLLGSIANHIRDLPLRSTLSPINRTSGFFNSFSPEQQTKILQYEGPENHGSNKFKNSVAALKPPVGE